MEEDVREMYDATVDRLINLLKPEFSMHEKRVQVLIDDLVRSRDSNEPYVKVFERHLKKDDETYNLHVTNPVFMTKNV